MKLPKFVKSIADVAVKHENGILTAVTIAGTLAAVYFAIKDTPKCIEVLDELNSKDEEVTNLDKAKAVLPIMGRTMMATAVAVGGALCNFKSTSKQIKELTGALETVSSGYSVLKSIQEEYRKEVGEEKAKEIEEKVVKNSIVYDKTNDASRIITTGHGQDLFYDAWSGRYFLSDINYVKKVVNDLNYQLMNEMHITANEFYANLGLPGIDAGKTLGWYVDYGQIDVQYFVEMDECDKPYTTMVFRNEPIFDHNLAKRW